MHNVYDGTLGMLQDTTKLTASIVNYMINSGEKLNYEITEQEDMTIVAILGKNDDERQIPMFNHPLIFKDMRNDNTVIALDFRLYVKKKLDDVLNIQDILQDRYNGELLMNRGIFAQYLITDDTSFLMGINHNLAYLFSSLVTGLMTSLVYDKTIGDTVSLASMLHFYNMDDNTTKIDKLVMRLPQSELKRLMHGDLKPVYSVLKDLVDSGEYDLSNDLLGTLLNNIKLLTNNNRLNGVNEDMLISAFGRAYYSVNNKEISISLVEDKATFLAVVHSVLTEGINSKSTLKTIAGNLKRLVKPDDIKRNLSLAIEDAKELI